MFAIERHYACVISSKRERGHMVQDKATAYVLKATDAVVHWVEVGVIAVLALLAVFNLAFIVHEIVVLARKPGLELVQQLFGSILLVFILLELYQIAMALLQGRNIVNKVFEVGLVSLVRSVIVSEFTHLDTPKLGVFALLIAALGVAWFLSRRGESLPPGGKPAVSAEESA